MFVNFKYDKYPHHPNQKYFLTVKGELFRKELLNANIEGTSEGVNEGVNLKIEGVKEGVLNELQYLDDIIAGDEGRKAMELNNLISKSLATKERYLKILKEQGFMEFKAASKTGGYYIKKLKAPKDWIDQTAAIGGDEVGGGVCVYFK